MRLLSLAQIQKDPISVPMTVATGTALLEHTTLENKEDVVALSIDGIVKDLSTLLPEKGTITFVRKSDPEGLEVLRHSSAHIMAQAVKELFPEVQVTIGPVIDNGFYYDFFRDVPFKEEDFLSIQERMHLIVSRNLPIVRKEVSKEEAIAFFKNLKEDFKVRIIQDLPEGQPISLYQQGDFVDLCRGPHLPTTGALGKGFCLTKLSGAYWRGDQKNPQLQRIYGTAWPTEQELHEYLLAMEEAKACDHRKLGREMDLFHFQEEAPGAAFWHPKGWEIHRQLCSYIRDRLGHAYQEVNTPQLVSQSLWKASGHWDKFRDNMFALNHDDMGYALKPMNCPCHVQIFNQGVKSYRDLPLRMSEFGSCMRDESSGSLGGLTRMRSFVQDDAHIFCTLDQIIPETQQFCQLLQSVYKDLGFEEIIVRFSSRPDERLGDDTLWDKAEAALCAGADAANLSYTHFPKEGAFYGPKLEFVLKDRQRRLWQCGTLQVDFVLPQRLGAFYVDPEGNKQHPVMLHRAILGSIERFMGILLEHYAGHLPFWLAPVQAVVATISEKSEIYAQEVFEALSNARFRAIRDLRPEKIGYKIREHSTQKIPCMVIVGEKEALQRRVSLRIKDKTHDLSLEELVAVFTKATKEKEHYPLQL